MIKLTRANGRDVWVEPSAIVMVESDGMKTTVVLAHGTMLLVKEDVQHVLAERLKTMRFFATDEIEDEAMLSVVPGSFTHRASGFVK